MTTIVGIKTNSWSIDAIVLGSDTLIGGYDGEEMVSKDFIYKTVSGDFWAMAHAGGLSDEIRRFYTLLNDPNSVENFSKKKLEKLIRKSVKKKRFIEINEINARVYLKDPDLDFTSDFLLTVNKPKMAFYEIDMFGNLSPPSYNKNYIVLGENIDETETYIKKELSGPFYNSNNVDYEKAMKIVRGVIQDCNSKPGSGGPMDLIVLRKSKIYTYGRRIKEALDKADESEFEDILREQLEVRD